MVPFIEKGLAKALVGEKKRHVHSGSFLLGLGLFFPVFPCFSQGSSRFGFVFPRVQLQPCRLYHGPRHHLEKIVVEELFFFL